MHHDQICFDAQLLQLMDAHFNPLKMCRIESGKIPVIPFCLPRIFEKIFFIEDRGIHRRTLIRIGIGFIQVIIVMLRKYTEPDLIKSIFLQCLQCLIYHFV